MIYTWKLNFVLLLSHFLVNLSTTNIDKVVSIPNMRWLNFLFQPIISVETKLGHQHWIDVILSTLFCQRWNNVDKHVSAQLSFSTKFQLWKNVGSLTLNWCNSINFVSTLFCQRWNNADKCTSPQLSLSNKYQRWCVRCRYHKEGYCYYKTGGVNLLQSGTVATAEWENFIKKCSRYHKMVQLSQGRIVSRTKVHRGVND